jgi:hypothetical protein
MVLPAEGFGGTGLGLSISKMLVTLSWRMPLKSEPGNGSCFSVYIPIAIIKNGNNVSHETLLNESALSDDRSCITENDKIIHRRRGYILPQYY